jgi:hypothetical protein
MKEAWQKQSYFVLDMHGYYLAINHKHTPLTLKNSIGERWYSDPHLRSRSSRNENHREHNLKASGRLSVIKVALAGAGLNSVHNIRGITDMF